MKNSRRSLPLTMQVKHGLFFRIPIRGQKLLKTASYEGKIGLKLQNTYEGTIGPKLRPIVNEKRKLREVVSKRRKVPL